MSETGVGLTLILLEFGLLLGGGALVLNGQVVGGLGAILFGAVFVIGGTFDVRRGLGWAR